MGRSLISAILEAHGLRKPKRRQGRSPDEQALRGGFEVFFPHAQWVGDGTQIPIEVNGKLFVFNVELDVDPYSGAFVGAAISRTEDSAAVIDTFRDAIKATGVRPLAMLLDNKPSNHTGEVGDVLEDTMLIRSTPFRPQNKAHIEGGFGLLKPTLDGLVLAGDSTEALAASYLRAIVIAWARTINHRPRADRGGRSRVDLLGDKPTSEEVERARQALVERLQKQDKARQTRAASQNPIVRAMIDDAYRRLGLDDPQGHILTATARYPLDAVVEAIAIFEGRRKAGTLPDDVDARYMMGIARNIALEHEAWEIAIALWDARVAAGELIAQGLEHRRSQVDDLASTPQTRLIAYIKCATDAESRLDRFFWLTAAADVVTATDQAEHEQLFRLAARRIASTHALHHKDRTLAIRFLAAKVKPLR